MKRAVLAAIIAGIAGIVAIAAGMAGQGTDDAMPDPTPEQDRPEIADFEKWLTSGPFQIDKDEYMLGEKIFVRIWELDATERGQIAFLRQTNDTHYTVYLTVPFDGMTKPSFNYYFEPQISKSRNICTAADLTGNWRAVFQGTEYRNLEFRVINQTLPGTEDSFAPAC